MWGFVVSKVLAGLFLVFWACLQALPGGVLSEGDRKTETQFSDATLKASNICSFICLQAVLIVAAKEALGTSSLHTPWTTAQVLYFLLGFGGGLFRLWTIRILKRQFTFSVGIVKDHRCACLIGWSRMSPLAEQQPMRMECCSQQREMKGFLL